MNDEWAISAFSALAQPSRMAIYRLLVRAGPEGVQVGEVARRLEMVNSTLSGHLSVLRRARLLKSTRDSREVRYLADLHVMRELIRFLLADCCDGQVSNCSEILSLLDA